MACGGGAILVSRVSVVMFGLLIAGVRVPALTLALSKLFVELRGSHCGTPLSGRFHCLHTQKGGLGMSEHSGADWGPEGEESAQSGMGLLGIEELRPFCKKRNLPLNQSN